MTPPVDRRGPAERSPGHKRPRRSLGGRPGGDLLVDGEPVRLQDSVLKPAGVEPATVPAADPAEVEWVVTPHIATAVGVGLRLPS